MKTIQVRLTSLNYHFLFGASVRCVTILRRSQRSYTAPYVVDNSRFLLPFPASSLRSTLLKLMPKVAMLSQ